MDYATISNTVRSYINQQIQFGVKPLDIARQFRDTVLPKELSAIDEAQARRHGQIILTEILTGRKCNATNTNPQKCLAVGKESIDYSLFGFGDN